MGVPIENAILKQTKLKLLWPKLCRRLSPRSRKPELYAPKTKKKKKIQ